MRMLSMIREVQPDDSAPVVIHCSAGCGRTGSLAAIDYVWNLLKQRQLAATFDVFEVVKTLRQYRQVRSLLAYWTLSHACFLLRLQ